MEFEDINGTATLPSPAKAKDPEGSDGSEGSEGSEDFDYELNYSKDITAPEDAYFEAIERRPIPVDIHELGIQLNSKRRTTAQEPTRGASTAWIDIDDSGTYDPKNERATRPRPAKKARISRDVEEDNVPKTPRLYRRVGYSFPMTFKFTHEKSLEYLRSISPGPSLPSYPCSSFSESVDREDNDSSYGSSRSRRKIKASQSPNTSVARSDGLTIDHLTEGHPQRRGCKGCFNIGDDHCSLIEFDDVYPCTACEDTGIDCELIIPPNNDSATPKTSKQMKKQPSRRAEVPVKKNLQVPPDTSSSLRCQTKHPKASSKCSSLEQIPSSSAIPHKRIKTCFAHPIQFNYVPDPEGRHPCSWCDMPFFGLWGHGEVEVEVIPYGGSIGNEEVEGGHYAAGKESTKMCITCTFSRLRITTCDGHIIQKIKGLDVRSFDTNELKKSFKALTDGDNKGGELASKTKWCNVCVAVAEYRCYTPPPFDEEGNPVPEGDTAKGCGLFLCFTCYDTVERIERSRGNARIILMDTLVRLRKEELWKHNRSMSAEGGDWVRADAEFLTSKGELMVRMRQAEDKGSSAGMGRPGDMRGSAPDRKGEEKDMSEIQPRKSNSGKRKAKLGNSKSHPQLPAGRKGKGKVKQHPSPPGGEPSLKKKKTNTKSKNQLPPVGVGKEGNGGEMT
ncbi:uncharacterized protein BP5553_00139 [Venustampulla echinocandica]|uniref:Zn(2)-C6 fungal-type domain-containing protein n=1 Tax=Venustampulla echinocandica TaxID=2656787 RepID=A0A370TXB2_9HELO|nr:uncharacterized protein BP5553_00139 [Venustampulla echinocandica]RDL40160.1 hypothetical protein BP5553_00139 [Venustampulla echinocandica]